MRDRTICKRTEEATNQTEKKGIASGGNGELKNMGQFLAEEDGMGTVEIILIIVVLVGLVLIFKDQLTAIVNSIFSKITKQTNKF